MAKFQYKIVDISQVNYTPEDGEVFQDRDSKENFIVQDGRWKHIVFEDLSPKMKLYDINKQIDAQQKPLTDEELAAKVIMINEWSNEYLDTYFMLYCKDLSYFTVLHKNSEVTTLLGSIVIECLKNIGSTTEIGVTDNAIEIWCDNHVMYLFPYDGGVEEV